MCTILKTYIGTIFLREVKYDTPANCTAEVKLWISLKENVNDLMRMHMHDMSMSFTEDGIKSK